MKTATAKKTTGKKVTKPLITKKVAKKTTTNLIIIDASGSMSSKVSSVKTSLKEILSQIKNDAVKDKDTVKATTIVVDFSGPGDFNTLVDMKDSCKLEDTVSEKYSTRDSTALYDAIGKTFAMVDKGEKNVFVSILTDGEENASREFDNNAVKALIEEKKKLGWLVTFIGTTQEAIESAVRMGISRGSTASYTNSLGGTLTAGLFMGQTRDLHYKKSIKEDVALACLDSDELLREAVKMVNEKDKYNDKGTENKGQLPDNTGGTEDINRVKS